MHEKQHLSELGMVDDRVTFSDKFSKLQICMRVYMRLTQMSAHCRVRDSRGDQMENAMRCVYSGFGAGGKSRWVMVSG